MSKGKNKAVVGILMVVFLFFVILMIFATYTLNIFKSELGGDAKILSDGKGDKIGVVEVNGVIMSSRKTVELLQKAEKDSSVKAIILRINSPGGAVGPTQEIYEEIVRIDSAYDNSKKNKKSKEKGKPIYASFGSIAASGGYYLGAATRKIFSPAGTITGSIGVIMQFMDMSKLYEFAKLSPEVIKSGKYKDAGQPFRSMTKEEKGLMDQMIRNVHKQFISDIMKRRKGRIREDINELAQGQIFSGEMASTLGLVDEIGSMWTAARRIHEELGLEGESYQLKYIKDKKKSGFMEIMKSLETTIKGIDLSSFVHKTPMLMVK